MDGGYAAGKPGEIEEWEGVEIGGLVKGFYYGDEGKDFGLRV